MIEFPDPTAIRTYFAGRLEGSSLPFPERGARDILNIFLSGLPGLIKFSQISSSRHYPYHSQLPKRGTASGEAGATYFCASTDIGECRDFLSCDSTRSGSANVQLFILDNTWRFYTALDACDQAAVKHIDGVGHYELNGSPDQLCRVLDQLGGVQAEPGSDDYRSRLSLLADSETFKRGFGTPQMIWPQGFYDAYYVLRDIELEFSPFPQDLEIPYYLSYESSAVPTMTRLLTASAIVTSTIGLIKSLKPDGHTVRWIDYGCGGGQIINLARPEMVHCHDYQIVGADSNASELRWARAQGAGLPNRSFLQTDALAGLSDKQFDLVTAFEFLKHLFDPISFIAGLNLPEGSYFIAGTPLNEPIRQGFTPHIWGFSQEDMKGIFAAAGLTAVSVNQSLYCLAPPNETDFLTVIGKKPS